MFTHFQNKSKKIKPGGFGCIITEAGDGHMEIDYNIFLPICLLKALQGKKGGGGLWLESNALNPLSSHSFIQPIFFCATYCSRCWETVSDGTGVPGCPGS